MTSVVSCQSNTERRWKRSSVLTMAPLGLKAIVGESKINILMILSYFVLFSSSFLITDYRCIVCHPSFIRDLNDFWIIFITQNNNNNKTTNFKTITPFKENTLYSFLVYLTQIKSTVKFWYSLHVERPSFASRLW